MAPPACSQEGAQQRGPLTQRAWPSRQTSAAPRPSSLLTGTARLGLLKSGGGEGPAESFASV